VKPDEGHIDYDKFKPKQTDKLVKKIIEGKVEKIKIKEEPEGSPFRRKKLN
jgi:protein required for attachment to host cells